MSNTDKRAVHTDALDTLGFLISEKEQRDAIHLAVEPVIAGEDLAPGEHIRIENGVAVSGGDTIGIVDPFITDIVAKGSRFWLVIYPRMITSLRHVWTHPAFDAPVQVVPDEVPVAVEPSLIKPKRVRNRKKVAVELPRPDPDEVEAELERIRDLAKAWLVEYADAVDADYTEMIDIARQHYDNAVGVSNTWPDYLIEGGKWEGQGTPDEFWTHFCDAFDLEHLTSTYKPSFFSCSC